MADGDDHQAPIDDEEEATDELIYGEDRVRVSAVVRIILRRHRTTTCNARREQDDGKPDDGGEDDGGGDGGTAAAAWASRIVLELRRRPGSKWTLARDVELHAGRALTPEDDDRIGGRGGRVEVKVDPDPEASKENSEGEGASESADIIAGVDLSLSLMMRSGVPAEERRLERFVSSLSVAGLASSSSAEGATTDMLGDYDVVEAEAVLTAPGYVPMVERRMFPRDLVLASASTSISGDECGGNGDGEANANAHATVEHSSSAADLSDSLNRDLNSFREYGLAHCPAPLPPTSLSRIRTQVATFIAEVEACFELHHPTIDYASDPFTFKEIGSRGGLRYDALVDLVEERWETLREVAEVTGPWLRFVNSVLPPSGSGRDGGDEGGRGEGNGDDDNVRGWKVNVSVVYSLPGALDQEWHADGRHLASEADLAGRGHADPYALCVFVPLIDLNHTVGFTEFFLKSHKTSRLLGFGPASGMVLGANVEGIVEAGEGVIYDYRLMHRGRANHRVDDGEEGGGTVRPVLQFLYSEPGYVERQNYGKRSVWPSAS